MSNHHSAVRWRRTTVIARASLTILLGLLMPLPVVAAERTATIHGVSPGGSDLFAVYDVSLSHAATMALRRASRPDSQVSGMGAARELEAGGLPTVAPPNSASSDLQRVERLRPVLEPILRQVGIPVQLMAVVLVESGGNPTALSPKGARGLWQLMPDTARRYGLVVDAGTDQRLNIEKSTRAAAEYLRALDAKFHNWPLALAAYNAGTQAVQRALVQTGGTSFSVAAHALPLETQNYVPAVFNAIAWFGSRTLPRLRATAHFEQAVYATGER